ncbi:MAG: VanZ family protein [Oscillospiraceae bacterium]|nr:VanZ family protein [Oscillospiraceae bacterium]
MRKNKKSAVWIDLPLSAALFAGYLLCVRPSFDSIGRLAFQIFSALGLSVACTLAGLLLIGDLKFIGLSLSLFTAGITAYALYGQIMAQLAAGEPFRRWIYLFYYDRPMTVALVWGAAFFTVILFRLLVPAKYDLSAGFKNFIRYASAGFLFFYACFLLYSFVLQRPPGNQSSYNLIPFKEIVAYFTGPTDFYEDFMYLMGNVFCFVPMGFYVKIYRKSWKIPRLLLIPAAVSVTVELSQLLLKTGHCDIDDVILNILGFFLGAMIVPLCDKARRLITRGGETGIF